MTSPPCAESVSWTIFKERIEISSRQVILSLIISLCIVYYCRVFCPVWRYPDILVRVNFYKIIKLIRATLSVNLTVLFVIGYFIIFVKKFKQNAYESYSCALSDGDVPEKRQLEFRSNWRKQETRCFAGKQLPAHAASQWPHRLQQQHRWRHHLDGASFPDQHHSRRSSRIHHLVSGSWSSTAWRRFWQDGRVRPYFWRASGLMCVCSRHAFIHHCIETWSEYAACLHHLVSYSLSKLRVGCVSSDVLFAYDFEIHKFTVHIDFCFLCWVDRLF